jgi:hypothetical protein
MLALANKKQPKKNETTETKPAEKMTNLEISLLKKILKLATTGNPRGEGTIEQMALSLLEGKRDKVIEEWAYAIKTIREK